MVPRLDADPLVDALALHVPAGASSRTSGSSPRTRARGRGEPEFELVDTGIFDDDRYWEITADYAKASPGGHPACACRCATPARRPRRSTCSRTLWFRNTWSWGRRRRRSRAIAARGRRARRRARRARHAAASRRPARPRRSSARTRRNAERLWGAEPATPYPEGRDRRPRRPRRGHRQPGADRHEGGVPATGSRCRPARPRVELRLAPSSHGLGDDFAATDGARASARPTSSTPSSRPRRRPATRRSSLRQALAGMLWSKQFFHYDVLRWLDGDPAGPPPPASAWHGRNHEWTPPEQRGRDLDARHVGVPVVRGLGPRLPLRRARPRRPGVREGAAAADVPRVVHAPERPAARVRVGFGDVNPPVHAWAALRVFEIDGATTTTTSSSGSSTSCCSTSPGGSTARTLGGNNLFEGGFLGLDNIGPFDRSAPAGRRPARAVRRHRLDGDVLPEPARDRARCSPSTTRPTRTWRRSSSSTSR